jgi:hypothetical protein
MPSREDPVFYSGELGSCRPLPPRPDVEFERKRAKRLLRRARAGDESALRTMALVAAGKPREELTLELAQLAVAREYGFASWLRLLQYYESWERQQLSDQWWGFRDLRHHRQMVKWILALHAQKLPIGAESVAALLPRLYGKSVEEVLASPLSEDEARFVVARQARCSSWDEVVARAERQSDPERWNTPFAKAASAIATDATGELASILREHPDVLHHVDADGGRRTLMWCALEREREERTAEARSMTDWLAAQGGDLQGELNRALCLMRPGPSRKDPDLDYLLERGADPDWVHPNGYSVLEHAIVEYNIRGFPKPHLVDALAKRAQRIPASFWVAAGLGDVEKTMSYLDRRGAPTSAARRDRPDFGLLASTGGGSFNPEATDLDIVWEAFLVAAINVRLPVLSALLDAGFPVDYVHSAGTMLHKAVGLFSPPLVEFLLSRGADPDLIALQNGSPRSFGLGLADWMAAPTPPECFRIREIFQALPPKAGPDRYAVVPLKG